MDIVVGDYVELQSKCECSICIDNFGGLFEVKWVGKNTVVLDIENRDGVGEVELGRHQVKLIPRKLENL